MEIFLDPPDGFFLSPPLDYYRERLPLLQSYRFPNQLVVVGAEDSQVEHQKRTVQPMQH